MNTRTPRLLVFVGTLVLSLGWAASVRAQAPPETIEYYATDALGSVRVVFTPTGQVLGRSAYLPFGDTLDQSGSLPRQRFTGQERDGEAGLDYFNARSLQVRTGRMSSPDPLFGGAPTDPQGWNRYTYGRSNPLRFVDPTGRLVESPIPNPKPCWADTSAEACAAESRDGYDSGLYDGTWGGSDTKPGKDGTRLPPPPPPPPPAPPSTPSSTPDPASDPAPPTSGSSAVPSPQKAVNEFMGCMQRYNFAASVGYLTGSTQTPGWLEGFSLAAQIGSVADLGAGIALKLAEAHTPGKAYGSTLKMALRQTAVSLGYSKLEAQGAAKILGEFVSPALWVVGAFTVSYDATVAMECSTTVDGRLR